MHWEVPLELSRGLREEHSPISKDWGHNEAKMGFKEGFIR